MQERPEQLEPQDLEVIINYCETNINGDFSQYKEKVELLPLAEYGGWLQFICIIFLHVLFIFVVI